MKKILVLLTILIGINATVQAQQSKKLVLTKLTALRDDYVGKIKAFGYTPKLKLPPVVLDNHAHLVIMMIP
jgi:hypothetical protein